jgi:hypothetical protein
VRCDTDLRSTFRPVGLLLLSADKFPILSDQAVANNKPFRKHICCGEFLSEIKVFKGKFGNKQDDKSSERRLQVATSNVVQIFGTWLQAFH